MNFYEKLLNLNGASANVKCGGIIDDESNFDPIYVPTALQIDFAVDLDLRTESDSQMTAYVQRMVSGLKAAVSGRRTYTADDVMRVMSAGMLAYQMYRALTIAIEASATTITDADSLTLFNVSGNTNQWRALRERVETLLDIVPITQSWADWFDAQFGIRKLKSYAGDTPLIMMPVWAKVLTQTSAAILNFVTTDFETAFNIVLDVVELEEAAQINADIRQATGFRDYRSRMNHLLVADWTDDMAAALHNTIGGTIEVTENRGDWLLSTAQLRYVANTNDEAVGYVRGRSGEAHLAIIAMSDKAAKDGGDALTNSILVVTAFTAYVAGRVYQINGDCTVSDATSMNEWLAAGTFIDAGLLPTFAVTSNRAESKFNSAIMMRDAARTVPINIDSENLNTVLATARGHLWFPVFEKTNSRSEKKSKDSKKGSPKPADK